MNLRIDDLINDTFDAELELQSAIETNLITMKTLQQKNKITQDALIEYHENLMEAANILKININPTAVTKPLLLNKKDELLKNLNLHYSDNNDFFIYGLSLNEKENNLLKSLQYDYALNHFCYLLCKAILLQIGRKHFDKLKEKVHPKHLQRIAIISNETEADISIQKPTWSLDIIRGLLNEIRCESFNVTANEQNCLSPIYSIIGLAMTK